VDVRDAAATADVLAGLRREVGPVRGLVHGAGVLADARIEDKTPEQFDRVYATKVAGLRSLLAAVEPDQLRALVLFSSSTGRFGRAGQVDYAVANEVLNKLARQQARRLSGCRVVSVNWGPWDGGMVTPALKKLFEQEGIGVIPLAEGARYLVQELRAGGRDDVEVVVLAGGPMRNEDKKAEEGHEGTRADSVFRVPPSALEKPLPLAFERVLSLAEHPVLADHVLDGRPVLPLALVLEWLAHGALHHNPGLAFHGCNDLRVLHGVILDGGPAPTLRVGAGKVRRQDGLFVTPVELRSARPGGREVLHARAEVLLATSLPPVPPPGPLPELRPYPRGPAEIYQDVLFHGPELRAIEQVEGASEQGIVAVVRTAPPPASWVRQPLRQRWVTDPLVLDAVFQLMIVWAQQRHGAVGLPCHVARYRQFRRSFPPGPVRVAVRVTRDSGLHALADIDLLDEAGTVIGRLEGCECAIDPGLERAFRRRALTGS
jgi:hypothetical protein